MSKQKEQLMSVRILPNTTSNPPGKLADAEVVFEADAGPLTGLKLIGFAVWERRAGGRNVTFPARQYSVNGERRSFALLRPANGDATVRWGRGAMSCNGSSVNGANRSYRPSWARTKRKSSTSVTPFLAPGSRCFRRHRQTSPRGLKPGSIRQIRHVVRC